MLPLWLLAAHALAAPLEAWQGPEIGDSRMVGMGGAYLAVADTGGASLDQPASLAVRRPLRADQRTQLDGSLIANGIAPFRGTPFAPTGLGGDDPNLAAQAGGVLKLGPTGLGAHLTRTGWAFADAPGYGRLVHGLAAVGGARAFGGGELVVGAFGHLNYATVTGGEDPVFGRAFEAVSLGGGATVGAIWAPSGSRWRLGGRFRTPGRAVPVGELARDVEVHWPLEAGLGVAWRTTSNVPATYGEGEAPERGGRYLLLAADLDLVGPTDGADFAALVDPTAAAGAPATLSLRLGAEAEVVEHVLKLRLGGYNEPGRQADDPARLHGTAGLAWFVGELPKGNGVRLNLGVDAAQDWLRIAFGVGAW